MSEILLPNNTYYAPNGKKGLVIAKRHFPNTKRVSVTKTVSYGYNPKEREVFTSEYSLDYLLHYFRAKRNHLMGSYGYLSNWYKTDENGNVVQSIVKYDVYNNGLRNAYSYNITGV